MPVRLLVFLHGTVLMHPGGVGHTRDERVAQVRDGTDLGIRDPLAYVPVDGAVAKLWRWARNGAEIAYLTSHRHPFHVAEDAAVLRRWGFPPGRVIARRDGQSYGDVAERELPDVLVEDDCESLDGDAEITYGQIRPELRPRIRSIVVPEFGGIDELPDSPGALLAYGRERRSRRGAAASPRWARELAHRH